MPIQIQLMLYPVTREIEVPGFQRDIWRRI